MKRRDLLKSYGKALSVGGLLATELNNGTSVSDFMSRNVANYVLKPRGYMDPSATEDIDIKSFTDQFTWEMDEMNGLYNTVDPVSRSVDRKRGDCKDYSAVAGSWILRHTSQKPEMVVYAPNKADYGHINIYSNGRIYDVSEIKNSTTPEGFVSSRDLFVLHRDKI